MTSVDHFSDSEDEQDAVVVPETQFVSAEEYEERITAHQTTISVLEKNFAELQASTAAEVQQIEAKRAEEKELFAKERAHHAEELVTRQSRIDFLIDRFISK